MTPFWTLERVKALEKLHTMELLAGSLNHGSHIVDKIQQLEALADDRAVGELLSRINLQAGTERAQAIRDGRLLLKLADGRTVGKEWLESGGDANPSESTKVVSEEWRDKP